MIEQLYGRDQLWHVWVVHLGIFNEHIDCQSWALHNVQSGTSTESEPGALHHSVGTTLNPWTTTWVGDGRLCLDPPG